MKFDSIDLGSYVALSGSSFNTVTTPSVFLTAGTHTLSFTGTNTVDSDNTQFIDNVRVSVQGVPDLVATSLTWDQAKGGVDFSYQLTGGDLNQDVPIAFYWASGSAFSTKLKKLDYPYKVPTGTKAQDQEYGPFHIDGANLKGSPVGTSYLLEVTDPDNTLGNFDPTKNVQPLKLVLDVPSLKQRDATWASTPLGHHLAGEEPPVTIGIFRLSP